ncbi:MAG: TonB-dependent receptor [Xanthomonadales bacterium]|jgi:outer membrane receptor protein involved in Fe transport|nr:TonB-dependent receptor [Xanthomonadales bacterium]
MTNTTTHPVHRLTRNALALAIGAGLAAQVQAQDQTENVLEEVIVTASKRETTLQDLSMSVSAISMEAMQRAEINDISRVDQLVPGMQFASSGNEVRIALRGTRQNNVGTEAEQSVGIFEDGVYVPTSTQALGAYVDVQRIEVLRGPQGTLYGRNTFGGTINIITNDPTFDDFYGSVSALYGDYDRYRLEGIVNIPVTDNFALRFAGMIDKHDGYIENTWLPGAIDDLNDRDLSLIRVSAKWQITDSLMAKLKVTKNENDTNGSAIWGYQQIGAYIDGEFFEGHQYAPDDASCCFDQGPWKIARNTRSNGTTDNMSYTLNVDWDFPDFATLRFIGNVTDFDGEQNYDPDYSDGGDPLNNGFGGWVSAQDTWSGELQLVSNTSGRLDWLLGLYYYEQKANWNWLDLVNGVPEIPHWDRQGDYVSDSFGAFAHATWNLNDDWRLVGGLRYAEDSKTEKDPLDWSVWPPVPDVGAGRDASWDKVLWKAGAEYDISDNVMSYFTASTGYRAGGFNSSIPGVPETYDPEEVLAYELGFKNFLLDGSMTLNVAAYWNDFTDMQAQSFILLNPDDTAVTEYTENGGAVDVKGVEVEMSWVPDASRNWYIAAQLSLMDAEFGKYDIAEIPGLGNLDGRQNLDDGDRGALSLKGWTPAMSPSYTFGTQVSYDFQLGDYGVLTPYAQAYFSDSYYGFDVNMPGNRQDSYTKLDLRLIWSSPTGAWNVTGYVLNATNEEVFDRALIFNPGGTDIASIQTNWSNPRTWGIQARWTF